MDMLSESASRFGSDKYAKGTGAHWPPAPSTEFATEPIPIFRTSPSKTARYYPQVELHGGQPPASCLSPVCTPRELQHTFRRENDALRAQTSVMSSQIADLAFKNAEVSLQNAMLSSQTAAMSAQMSAILARLEALTNYSGECGRDASIAGPKGVS
ncbi:uncharacterized protein TRAVEDRAFT_20374 [Trametes versicolor FP-101664 SS1]|uniref:uncharacterized protein n=1 Tax=Trametes versicolor (strain FP-101664) TaxID=717944 RepID=UPI0004623DF6|nr:uncharacterized protein TRAVEDRAFT_20374 [Trametes versicolor FP-101664 SS1]EIW58342.1 hypothetical protein TRAVEDRAFT_20374 [Trametes versicolor FP-101664 SS1]